MKSKILFSIIFLTFLISSVFAVTIDVDYEDFTSSKTIINGQSINVYVDGGSMHPPTSISVRLNSNVIYQESISSTEISRIYTITPYHYSNSPGTYTIEVIASDSSNTDSGAVTLTVNPVAPVSDTTAPVITLIGSNPQTISQGSAYTELGATASDDRDGDLTSRITRLVNVNTNIVGTYYVTYSVLDNAGNSATATRTIYVISSSDTIAPVITLIGDNPQIVELGSTYSDAGATATDNIDGTITPVLISNNVNANVVGIYSVTYRATDAAGNSATATRTVNVRDTTAPTIESISDDSVTEGKEYEYQVEATDFSEVNYSIEGAEWLDIDEDDGFISGTKDSVSSNKDYEITVTVTDEFGNSATETFTLTVKNKKSSGGSGGAGSVTTSTIKDETIPSTNVVIPQTITTKNKIDAKNILFYFMIATTTMGIVVVSLILFREIKKIKNSKNKKQIPVYQPQNQDSPYY